MKAIEAKQFFKNILLASSVKLWPPLRQFVRVQNSFESHIPAIQNTRSLLIFSDAINIINIFENSNPLFPVCMILRRSKRGAILYSVFRKILLFITCKRYSFNEKQYIQWRHPSPSSGLLEIFSPLFPWETNA